MYLSPDAVMAKRYPVSLSSGERRQLGRVIVRGTSPARIITRARIVLKAADDATYVHIIETLGCGSATVGRVRRRFATGRLEMVLRDKALSGQRSPLAARP